MRVLWTDQGRLAEVARFSSGCFLCRKVQDPSGAMSPWNVWLELKAPSGSRDLIQARFFVRSDGSPSSLDDLWIKAGGEGLGELRWFLETCGVPVQQHDHPNHNIQRLQGATPVPGTLVATEQDKLMTMLGEPPSCLLQNPEFEAWVLSNQESWESMPIPESRDPPRILDL